MMEHLKCLMQQKAICIAHFLTELLLLCRHSITMASCDSVTLHNKITNEGNEM